MEEKKLDPYQLIGFVLIALIMTWMLMRQQEQNLNNQAKVKSESESLNESEKKLPSQNSKETNKESLGLENLNYSNIKLILFLKKLGYNYVYCCLRKKKQKLQIPDW